MRRKTLRCARSEGGKILARGSRRQRRCGRKQGSPLASINRALELARTGDYQLRSRSNALNRGTNRIERMPSFDFLGKPKIQDYTVISDLMKDRHGRSQAAKVSGNGDYQRYNKL
jgi:hypothetical protein